MYCDRRMGGTERWFFSEPPDTNMRIPNWVRKCVVFLAYRDDTGKVYLAGTGFLVFRPVSDIVGGFVYLVTAAHVIQGIKDKGCDKVFIRIDFKDGTGKWAETDVGQWIFHPTDPLVDVAVLQISGQFAGLVAVEPFTLHVMISSSELAEKGVGVGTEVFLSGLFTEHPGVERNIPIVRVGNIAATPEEKVKSGRGFIDAYLVETRSIGGLSGSPVFVHLGLWHKDKGVLKMATSDEGIIYFLGLMQGHWDSPGLSQADVASDESQKTEERVNMGIGIVVPAEKIVEVIRHPKIEERNAAELEKHANRNLPVQDTASYEEHVFTKEDFDAALKKVSKRLPPSQSGEEK